MTRWAQLGAATADHIVLDHEMSRTLLLLPLLSSRQIKNSWRNCSGKLQHVTRPSETQWGLGISNPDKIILLPVTQRRLNMVYYGCYAAQAYMVPDFSADLVSAQFSMCYSLSFWSGFWHLAIFQWFQSYFYLSSYFSPATFTTEELMVGGKSQIVVARSRQLAEQRSR